MDQQKIDRLFREKLDSYEATPSNQAWLEVEKKIGSGKSSTKFYWIAAAVSAILITWVVWPKQQQVEVFTPIATEVNHPTQNIETAFEWTIPEIEKELIRDVAPKIPKQAPIQLVAEEKPLKNQVKDDFEETIDLTPEQNVDFQTAVADLDTQELENTTPTVDESIEEAIETPNEKIKVDLSKVKITYIAANSAEKEQEKDSVGAFKKFIAFAGKLSPGEMLADLKTKKDDLINGGLKSKEKDRTSL